MPFTEIYCNSNKPLELLDERPIEYRLLADGLAHIGQAKLYVRKYADGTFWVRLETLLPDDGSHKVILRWFSLNQPQVDLIAERPEGEPGSKTNPDLQLMEKIGVPSFWVQTFFPE